MFHLQQHHSQASFEHKSVIYHQCKQRGNNKVFSTCINFISFARHRQRVYKLLIVALQLQSGLKLLRCWFYETSHLGTGPISRMALACVALDLFGLPSLAVVVDVSGISDLHFWSVTLFPCARPAPLGTVAIIAVIVGFF